MSVSDLSSLSSAESIESDEELKSTAPRRGTLDQYFQNAKAPQPPLKRKRPASPPHEYILADNPDIAFIVMFRARFNDVFPKSLPNFGPQDIERGVVSTQPEENIEKLLCSLIGLALNRKKDVERGHHTRALEEAISTYSHQWPPAWDGKNPLSGGASFDSMNPEQRLSLLKALIMWSLQASEAVRKAIAESYKGQRYEHDLTQERSVQPWGSDGENRRYWLIEGLDDTNFRVYRENNPALKTRTWWSVADSIDGVKALGDKLREEGSQKGGRLANAIEVGVNRFEAGEEKRKRREYRQARKAQFRRADPGMSLYEGRTRGKRIRYTFSDDEDGGSDVMSGRRSRNSGGSTPVEPAGPVVTASGRHIRPRAGGIYGESLLSGQQEDVQPTNTNGVDGEDASEQNDTRSRTRQAQGTSRAGRAYHKSYNAVDEIEDESDAPSSEWESGKEDDEDVDENIVEDDEDEGMSDEGVEQDGEGAAKGSLMVSLKIGKAKAEALKTSTPDRLGPEGDNKANGASPAGSTIVLNNTHAKVNGESAPVETHSAPPQVEAMKVEHIITPTTKPIQTLTPPLSDNPQPTVVDNPTLPKNEPGLDYAA